MRNESGQRHVLVREPGEQLQCDAVRGCRSTNGLLTWLLVLKDVLGKYLKVEMGFPGQVNADVGGQHTVINSANAGMDFSTQFTSTTMTEAVNNGSLTMDRLNDMVMRNAIAYYKLGQDEGYPELAGVTDLVDNRGDHASLARAYAAESMVLLKNVNNALPLKNISFASIFGYHAAPRYVGANYALNVYGGLPSTEYGHMTTVGGSASMFNSSYVLFSFSTFRHWAGQY